VILYTALLAKLLNWLHSGLHAGNTAAARLSGGFLLLHYSSVVLEIVVVLVIRIICAWLLGTSAAGNLSVTAVALHVRAHVVVADRGNLVRSCGRRRARRPAGR
jgi:hypothetical protein